MLAVNGCYLMERACASLESELSKLMVGDLVTFSCYKRRHPVDPQAVASLNGIVTEVSDSNVYEPAEAQVYFGCLEAFEWYPVRALSLVPDEER